MKRLMLFVLLLRWEPPFRGSAAAAAGSTCVADGQNAVAADIENNAAGFAAFEYKAAARSIGRSFG